jgi:hypothetical protein
MNDVGDKWKLTCFTQELHAQGQIRTFKMVKSKKLQWAKQAAMKRRLRMYTEFW